MKTSLISLLLLFSALIPQHLDAAAEVVVIDLDAVQKGATIYNKRFEQLAQERNDAQASLTSDVEEIDKLNNQLQIYNRSQPQHAELTEKIEVAKFKVKLAKKRVQEQIKKKHLNILKTITNDIQKKLGEYCAEKGHKIVIPTLSSEIQAQSADQFLQELSLLNAIYGAPDVNITDDFIGWLNAKHGAADGGGDAAAPKPDGGAQIEVME